MLSTFTFIAEFRGGTYCSQVQAASVIAALPKWVQALKKQKKEIKFLGDKVIAQIEAELTSDESHPVLLQGLKNVWFHLYPTNQGSIFVNIVQTKV